MTIEDIDYLIENSELQSLTIVIDSRDRDFKAYPTPSLYSIGFEEPIKNVVGFEILDASIPVTEFSIDKHNNILCVGYIFHSIGTTQYQACEYFTNFLQYSETFKALYENDSDASFFVYTDLTEFNGIQNTIPDESHNILIYFESKVLGSGSYVIKDVDGIEYPCNFDPRQFSEYYIKSKTEVIVFKIAYIDMDVAIEMASVMSTRPRDITSFDVIFCNVYKEIPIRNYTSSKLYDLVNKDFLTNPISNAVLGDGRYLKVVWEDDPISSTDLSITQKFIWVLESGSKQYNFYLDFDKSTCVSSLGFSQLNPNRFNSKLKYRDYKRLFISDILDGSTTETKLVSPGLICLEDVRYVELHCPEIESHILGSYSHFKYAPGIGLFKLIDTNTISHLRFDFLNIIRKPFHPIGKLSRLTFSFTNRNGILYDFKSIDHTILISIKYYSPKQNKRIPQSILNKMYQPDLLAYKLRGNSKEKNNRYLEDLLQEQKRYLQ